MRRSASLAAALGVIALTIMTRAEPARAGRPSAADAARAAAAWLEAMALQPGATPAPPAPPAAVALTAPTLHAFAFDNDQAVCPEKTASDAAGVARLLACLRAHVAADGKLEAWSPAVAKEPGVPRSRAKLLRALEKTATLVVLEADCAGSYNQVVFAVEAGPRGPRVAAVLAQTGDCTE